MIIFLSGPDTYRSLEHLKKMTKKFKEERDPQELNTVILDITEVQDNQVMDQVMAVPFLAEKRMLVLKNLLSATGKGDLQSEILQKIKENNLPSENIYIFWEGSAKPKTKIAKELLRLLEKQKYSQSFVDLNNPQLNSWIVSFVQDRGGQIDNLVLQKIISNLSPDTWRISSLLEQLLAYCEGKIEPGALDNFLSEKDDDNIFNLVDMIVSGQKKQVYKMIREQYRNGKDAGYVFSMILRQFRILIQLRDLYDRFDSLSSSDIAKQLGLHPFVVKKSLPLVKSTT